MATPEAMHPVIDRILRDKREEVAARKKAVPVASLLRSIETRADPSGRFLHALSAHRFSLIAEIKRKAPSHPDRVMREDVCDVARIYASVPSISCLSVLTDETHFGCGPEDLQAVRAVTGKPILRKDFVFDEYQVLEARAWGADAVLLIATLLEADLLARLVARAQELGLEPFIETHEESDFRNVPASVSVWGINARNLRGDLSTDLAIVERLLPRVPAGKIVVAESGVRSPDDARRMFDAGARAILVGGSIVFSNDVKATVGDLLGGIPG